MSQIHVEDSRVINARPEVVYAILSDYQVDHPAILPKPAFEEVTVEQGGQGAGTVFSLRMNVMGSKRTSRFVVTEAQPGRVLVETSQEAGIVTSFTVDPVGDGSQSQLTIATDLKSSGGPMGLIERFMVPRVLRPIYGKELEQIAAYARNK
jgi:hypothetical protein